MYLTRVYIDENNRKTMKALNSPNLFHGAIGWSFEGTRQRNLWRLDSLNGKLYVLILSEDKPDLTSFCEQFSISNEWETKDYDGLLGRIKKGSCWRFRLTANPTKSSFKRSERGKVFSCKTPNEQKNWLIEKGKQNGFSLTEESFDVVQIKWNQFYKKDNEKNRYVRILSVTYEGVLNVINLKQLLNGKENVWNA